MNNDFSANSTHKGQTHCWFPQVSVGARAEKSRSVVLKQGATVEELVRALGSIGSTPREVIAIRAELARCWSAGSGYRRPLKPHARFSCPRNIVAAWTRLGHEHAVARRADPVRKETKDASVQFESLLSEPDPQIRLTRRVRLGGTKGWRRRPDGRFRDANGR